MVIGRAGYVAGGIVMNQLKPNMLNVDGWNWGAKSGFFFLGFDIAFFAYLFFYLPETRNRYVLHSKREIQALTDGEEQLQRSNTSFRRIRLAGSSRGLI